MKFSKLFQPYPAIYSLPPLFASLIAFSGLYGVIQVVRIFVHHLPFVTPFAAVNVGDSICVPIFVAFAAKAMRLGYQEPAEPRWYSSKWWYISIGAIAMLPALALTVNDLARGYPLLREFTPIQVAHSVIVPIWGAFILGVLPHIWVDVKGQTAYKIIAMMAILGYAGSLGWDAGQGWPLPEA